MDDSNTYDYMSRYRISTLDGEDTLLIIFRLSAPTLENIFFPWYNYRFIAEKEVVIGDRADHDRLVMACVSRKDGTLAGVKVQVWMWFTLGAFD